MKKLRIIIPLIVIMTALAACGGGEQKPSPTPVISLRPTATATVKPTPDNTPGASLAPSEMPSVSPAIPGLTSSPAVSPVLTGEPTSSPEASDDGGSEVFNPTRGDAQGVSDEIVKIDGVNKAVVVISGSDAVMGIETADGVSLDSAMSAKIEAAAKKACPGLKNLMLSSDAETVGKIRELADKVRNGGSRSDLVSLFAAVADMIGK